MAFTLYVYFDFNMQNSSHIWVSLDTSIGLCLPIYSVIYKFISLNK